MIAQDSPFRALPATLPRRTVLFFDGLRLSAEMADLGYRRLQSLLVRLSSMDPTPLGTAPVEALSDAWSTIDNVNRFRELLRSMPGLKHNAVYESFVRGTAIVEELRDAVRHLNNRELAKATEEGLAPLGTVTWIAGAKLARGRATGFTLHGGTRFPGLGTFGPVFDLERIPIDDQIHSICLALVGRSASLDDLVSRVASMIRSLEPGLALYSDGKPRLGSDQLIGFSLEPADSTEDASPALPQH